MTPIASLCQRCHARLYTWEHPATHERICDRCNDAILREKGKR